MGQRPGGPRPAIAISGLWAAPSKNSRATGCPRGPAGTTTLHGAHGAEAPGTRALGATNHRGSHTGPASSGNQSARPAGRFIPALSAHVLRALAPPRRGPRRHPAPSRTSEAKHMGEQGPAEAHGDRRVQDKANAAPRPAAACWPRGGERLPRDGVLGACPARRLCEGTLAMTWPELGPGAMACPPGDCTGVGVDMWTETEDGGWARTGHETWGHPGALRWPGRLTEPPLPRACGEQAEGPDPGAPRLQERGWSRRRPHTALLSRSQHNPRERRGPARCGPGNHVRGAGRGQGRAVVTAQSLLFC